VEATFTLPRRFAKAIEIRDGDRVVPSVLLSALRASDDSLQEARVALLAEAPPLGFASYAVASATTPKADPAAVTPYWDTRFDAGGGIAAVADRAAGQMLLRDARFAAVIEGKPCVAEGKWRVRSALPGAQWTTAIEEGAIGGIPYRLEMKSWATSPRLDFRVVFEFDGQRIGAVSDNKRDARSPFLHEDKLRFKFYPVAREGSIGIRDLPFVIAGPVHSGQLLDRDCGWPHGIGRIQPRSDVLRTRGRRRHLDPAGLFDVLHLGNPHAFRQVFL
jgi:alpha-mannosidase